MRADLIESTETAGRSRQIRQNREDQAQSMMWREPGSKNDPTANGVSYAKTDFSYAKLSIAIYRK